VIVGRRVERERIASLLADAREGRSGVLVVRGEAGIGKTALLAVAEAESGEMDVLRSTGVQSEAEIPFAALHQLVRPYLALVDSLPKPQAAALRGAFGMTFDRSDDAFLTALALLSLLAEAATRRPLLCLIDDAQWLDRSSADALLFAARRLHAEPIAMLIAAREGDQSRFEAPGFSEVTLQGLSDGEAREVLASRVADTVGGAEVESLIQAALGNPLALLELPIMRAHVGGRAAGEAVPSESVSSLQESFRARVEQLPAQTRRVLLLTAADDVGDVACLRRAAAHMGSDLDLLEQAASEGLIRINGVVTFRHPLIRSTVYRSASPQERRAAHAALAAVLDEDPGRRAWHRAEAAEAEDDAVALELEVAADEALARGAHAAAAAAFERAAELSELAPERGRRLVRAARASLDSGRRELALALADRGGPLVADPHDQAEIEVVRAAVEFHRGIPDDAHRTLMDGAIAIADSDPRVATSMILAAIEVSAFGGWPERAFVGARKTVRRFESTASPEEEFLRVLLGGLDALADGDSSMAAERLTEAVGRGEQFEQPQLLRVAAAACVYLGDPVRARKLYQEALAAARSSGSFHELPISLFFCAHTDAVQQRVIEAAANATEGIAIARELGQENLETVFLALLARVAAFQGREVECRSFAAEAIPRALAHNLGTASASARLALAELDLGLGNLASALEQFQMLSSDTAQIAVAIRTTPDFVETAVRSGQPQVAAQALERFAPWAAQAPGPSARGVLARCRGLAAAEGVDAEPFFRESVELLAEGAPPFERARSHLVYGEFLRRAKRRLESRIQLRAALDTFQGMGAALWEQRTRDELHATGETARKRDPSTVDQLTPQERRVAQLAAEGGSNRDIAAQLFLSPKTVEYHLHKVFLKLDVHSRVELARVPLETSAPS
jgi:DNA-binding CsgD family transcriptional regulator